MTTSLATPALLALCTLIAACSAASPLGQAEQSCARFPTPDAQADCQRRQKAQMDAFRQHEEAAKRREPEAAEPGRPANPLCFKRQGTGEWVCPN